MRPNPRSLYCLTLLLAAGALTPTRAADEPDPWIGKPAADVVALLGEASRSKQEKDGGRTLSYKLLRLEDGVLPPPGVMPLALPGVGLVGVVEPRRGSPRPGSVGLGPVELDDQGRAVGGGGLEQTASASMGWSSSKGKQQDVKGDPGRPGTRGKITVKFRVDPDGRIREWSAPPPGSDKNGEGAKNKDKE